MYLKSNVVWKAYTEEKQTIHELSLRYKVSESTIKRLLKNVSVEWHNPKIGGHGIVNIDATYFCHCRIGHEYGQTSLYETHLP